jgi:hypothetical protein
MRTLIFSLIACAALVVGPTQPGLAADKKESDMEAVGTFVEPAKVAEKDAIRVVKDPAIKKDDEPTFAKRAATRFANGTIEVKVLSRLLKDAPAHARGFIGVAFRINEDDSKFECIYVRPLNSRADDQVRRNHSIQYFSYPDFKFDRLRKESPEKYESYTDMAMDEWIDLKIVVRGARAELFINNAKQPSLIVNDLKHGPDASGAIGLWVDIGTEGYFSDLKIRNDD